MTIIRVFPRRTSFTPTDPYAFVGDPPLWRPEADEVHVSVTFTWDVDEGYRLQRAWSKYYDKVLIGGPAIDKQHKLWQEYVSGMYVKPGVTFTSRGCVRCCPWCLVPSREGSLLTLPITPGWIIQDNNLLACPREHLLRVFAMCRAQNRQVSFSGGLDARLVDAWVADQLSKVPIKEVFLAADYDGALDPLCEAVKRLLFLGRHKTRCYVMIGYNGETIEQATERLETVWSIGCMPFAQLYQPADRYINYPPEWRRLARKWQRPAAMISSHKEA